MTTAHDPEFIAAAVTTERLVLCDLLKELDADDWRQQSLCDLWTVHEVVAHLSLARRETLRGMLAGMIKARGNWERMNAEQAIAHARQFPPQVLVQQLRDSASSTRRAPMSNPIDPLIDILVHAQDIARPLGRNHVMAYERVEPALTYALDSRWYGAKKRFNGLTLSATDGSRTFGTGDKGLAGPAGDLLLVAAGRTAGMSALAGSGLEILQQRMGQA